MARVRILSAEFDSLRSHAIERTRAIDTKASFVVFAATAVAALGLLGLVRAESWYTGLLPIALTVGTIIAAAVALWPSRFKQVSATNLSSRWLDTSDSADDLERYLLRVKAKEIAYRNANNERRSKAVKWAFVLLVLSLLAALAVGGPKHDWPRRRRP